MSTLPPPPSSLRPSPSAAPPSVAAYERHDFATAEDGTRLFVRSRDGSHAVGSTATPRAFFCDGIACEGFVWKYLWDDLAPTLPLTHWNYRGHGRSARPVDAERIDIPALASDLSAVRAHMGDPPSILVGHSMGVQVCLENYRAWPQNVRALVLICGTFGRLIETFHLLAGVPVLKHLLPSLLGAVAKRPSIARALWSRLPRQMSLNMALRLGELDVAHIDPQDMMPYLAHVTSIDLGMFLGMLHHAGEHTAEELLPDIQVPVLVVAGERDTFTPCYLAEKMAAQLPDAELLVVKGGSHVASLEQHQMVDDAIADFIKRRAL